LIVTDFIAPRRPKVSLAGVRQAFHASEVLSHETRSPLVRVDRLIVTSTNPTTLAAKKATTTILGLPARAPPIAPAEAGADDVDPDLDPEYV